MTDSQLPTASYDGQSDALKDGDPGYVKLWLDAIALADAEEKDWRGKAEDTLELFRGKKQTSFNIFHSNIETLCPALYNSTPVPDVRRRYGDPDRIGKVVADLTERSISLSIDNYDFDDVIKRVIRDGEITGRGIPRIRYEPTFDEQGMVAYEAVTCEYVPWRYFRRGPGRTWADIPWIAFGDFLTKDQIGQLNPELASVIPYNYTSGTDGNLKKAGSEEASIFKRAFVWQIWDKETKRVISVCQDYEKSPVKVVDDPLGLTGFFPVPRPYQPIVTTDSLEPVTPYKIYAPLAEELNTITDRISRLVKQLRPRGGYVSDTDDIKNITEAGDGDLIPLTSGSLMIAAMQGGGGIDKMITWFPLDPTVKALAQLVQQRELIKQTIYEVTGISDILRGSTQASETATAQQIKTQWGSLRIQDRQAEVARLIRDVFRMKAEIIATKFAWETLTAQTGISIPDNAARTAAQQQVQSFMQAVQQAQQNQQPPPPMPPNGEEIKKAAEGPSREEVEAVLRNDITRMYRIDVESDSTIRGDLTRNQQTMGLFLQGTAQFAQAMGPLVEQNPEALGPVMEIYAAFARQFKLGKQAEDALTKVTDGLRSGQQAAAQKPQDPKLELEKQRLELERQGQQQEMQFEQQKHEQSMQFERDKFDHEMQLRQHESEQKTKLDLDKHAMDVEARSKPVANVNFDANQALGGLGPQITQIVQANSDAMASAVQTLAQSAATLNQTTSAIAHAAHVMSAPKRIVRDPAGRAIGAEPIINYPIQ